MDEDLKTYLQGMEERLGSMFDTKLAAVEQRFDAKLAAMEQRFDAKLAAMEERFDAKLEALEHRLIEKMREMQTELLRGFEAFANGFTIRLRKVEADVSNLNTATTARMDIIDSRMLQIELRLGMEPPTPPAPQ